MSTATTVDPAGTFLAAFTSALDGSGADAQAAAAALADARPDIPAARIDDLSKFAAALIEAAASNRALSRPLTEDVQGRLRHSRLAQMQGLLDRVLIHFDEADALTDAQTALADARAAYLAKRSLLEDSIAVADIDAVIRLRTDIEVGLPKRIADLELTVADLLAARAAAEVSPSKAALAQQEGVYAKKEAAHAAAVAAVHAAYAELLAANSELATARDHVQAAEVAARAARTDRDTLDAGHKAELARRQRRLAGIPEPESDTNRIGAH